MLLLPPKLLMYSMTLKMFTLLGIDNDISFVFKILLEGCVEDVISEIIGCLEFALKKFCLERKCKV